MTIRELLRALEGVDESLPVTLLVGELIWYPIEDVVVSEEFVTLRIPDHLMV